jgi:uncharacterized protein
MKYTEKLLKHPEFLQIQEEITQWERERTFCHHEMAHSLDVCRMAWIMYLEDFWNPQKQPFLLDETSIGASEDTMDDNQQMEAVKDAIYLSGLLHDIGRAAQYAHGVHHAVAGGEIAHRILTDISCPDTWTRQIEKIISGHNGNRKDNKDLTNGSFEDMWEQIHCYIRRADHLSRNCFLCQAVNECKWEKNERNQTVLL